MKIKDCLVLIRGGGDAGSAVAIRLFNCGFPVIITEISEPLVVRRSVSFANCVYEGDCEIENVKGKLVNSCEEVLKSVESGFIPVIVDPEGAVIKILKPVVVIDAVMSKKNVLTKRDDADIVIGLGPGFTAGEDVDAVVETLGGHYLGRVIYNGKAEENTGTPRSIDGYSKERVFRAPCDGVVHNEVNIGDMVKEGQLLCKVDNLEVKAQLTGVVRGIIHDGINVTRGLKLGDIDPRGNVQYINSVSDRMRSIAGGALEAILTLLKKKHMELSY